MFEYHSESIENISKALAKAFAEVKSPERNKENPYYKSKYADLEAVLNSIRPAFAKNGLSLIQFCDNDEDRLYLITEILHESGEWIRGRVPVVAVKPDPQSMGSAITYARRYLAAAMGGISQMDDDDAESAMNRDAAPVRLVPKPETKKAKVTEPDSQQPSHIEEIRKQIAEVTAKLAYEVKPDFDGLEKAEQRSVVSKILADVRAEALGDNYRNVKIKEIKSLELLNVIYDALCAKYAETQVAQDAEPEVEEGDELNWI